MSSLRKDLRAIMADGVASNAMIGLGETYLPAFVLALTASQVASGLVATGPMFLGALLQLVSPYVVRSWHSYRRWVVVGTLVQASLFIPLALGAWRGAMPCAAVFLCASVYWGTGMAGGTSWNAWIGPLIPRRVRARYFASRTRYGQLGQLLAFLVGGAWLQWGAGWGEPLRPFALIFLAAAAIRFFSAWLLQITGEPSKPGPEVATLQPRQLWARVRQDRLGPTLLYILAVQSSVQIASPYFTPYMLRHLGFSYSCYVQMLCASYLAKVVCLPWLGRLVDRWGAKRMATVWGLAIAPIPALWLVSDSFGYLLLLQVLGGAIWAGFELSMLLLWFGSIPQAQRVSILTVFNLGNATAVLLGSLAGGALLSALDAQPEAYWTLFALSSLARLLALGLVLPWPRRAVPPAPTVPAPAVVRLRLPSPHWSGPANPAAEDDLSSEELCDVSRK